MKNIKIKYLLFQLVLLIGTIANGQNSVLSKMDTLLSKMSNDSVKVDAYIEMANNLFHNRKRKEAFQLLNKSLQLSKKFNYQKGLVRYWDTKGYMHRNLGEYSEALKCHKKALTLAQKAKLTKGLSRIYNNIGVVYRRLDDYPEGVKNHLKALEYSEKYNDTRSSMYAYNSLGNIYLAMKQYEKSLLYLNKAVKMAIIENNKRSLAINFNNIGELYEKTGDNESALNYYFKSLKLNQELSNDVGIAICYDCIGRIYRNVNNYNKAIQYFKQALEKNIKINDAIYIATANVNIGTTYARINQYKIAKLFLQKGLKQAKNIGSKTTVKNAYLYLSQLYEKTNQLDSALINYKKFDIYKDSILNTNSNATIAKLQTLYNTEKQQKKIELLKTENKLNAKLSSKKSIIIIILSFSFIIVLFLIFILYKALNRNKKNTKILEKQSLEIIKTNTQLKSQKELIEEKSKRINDSLKYARKIQQALLPKDKFLNKIFEKHFVFYKPLGVVSGDFYWAAQQENKIAISVADCTGHSVPGALLSMLGNSYLNESLRFLETKTAGEILDNIKNMFTDSLHQEGKIGETKDGMDISLCVYNKDTNTMEYAGAHMPLIIVRKNEMNEPELIEYKGDLMPVGYWKTEKTFTTHTIKLQKNDLIYMYSDGYIDQFNYENKKRFMRKNFKKLIEKASELPFDEQRHLFEVNYNNWKGNIDQIDDVVILGFKF